MYAAKLVWILLVAVSFAAGKSRGKRSYQSCGGYLSTEGSFKTPHHPNNYPNNAYCVWTIVAPPGQGIVVERHTIDLEQHSACGFDYVQYSYARQSEVHCGNKQLGPLKIRSRSLTIIFETDSSTVFSGFEIRYKFRNLTDIEEDWSTTPFTETTGFTESYTTNRGFSQVPETTSGPVCGRTLRSPGHIRSPNYPYPYPNNVFCRWQVEAPYGKRIRVYAHEINIEHSSSCRFDFLQFRDEGRRRIHCGNRTVDEFVSISNLLTVEFWSDSSVQGYGFSFNFDFIDAEVEVTTADVTSTETFFTTQADDATTETFFTTPGVSCGGTLRSSGYIESPNYPNSYPNNAFCKWRVEAPYGKRIRVHSHEIDIEDSNTCRYDALRFIHDGYNRVHCGSKTVDEFVTQGNILVVEFESDGIVQRRGFRTFIEFIDGETTGGSDITSSDEVTTEIFFTTPDNSQCGEHLTSPGVLRSPGYPSSYPPNTNCFWTIEAPEGYYIFINYHNIEVEHHVSCLYDYVKYIYNGIEEVYCGRRSVGPIHTYTNRLTVQFKSDHTVQLTGFEAPFLFIPLSTTKEPESSTFPEFSCGGTIRSEAVIGSPNHPDVAPSNLYCEWSVEAANDEIIMVQTHSIALKDTRPCKEEYVQYFYDGKLEFFCGETSVGPIITNSNQLTIVLRTGLNTSSSGFSARITFQRKTTKSFDDSTTADPVILPVTAKFTTSEDRSTAFVDLITNREIETSTPYWGNIISTQGTEIETSTPYWEPEASKFSTEAESSTFGREIIISSKGTGNIISTQGTDSVKYNTGSTPRSSSSEIETSTPYWEPETSTFSTEAESSTFGREIIISSKGTDAVKHNTESTTRSSSRDLFTYFPTTFKEGSTETETSKPYSDAATYYYTTPNTRSADPFTYFSTSFNKGRTETETSKTDSETETSTPYSEAESTTFGREIKTSTKSTDTVTQTTESTIRCTGRLGNGTWVPASHGTVPFFSLQGGRVQNDPVYICRSRVAGSLLPGMLLKSQKACLVPEGGVTFQQIEYEVLTNPHRCAYYWKDASNGEVPCNGVAGGETESGEILYIGQQYHLGQLIPGKIQPSARALIVPSSGFEYLYHEYKALCQP